MVRLTSSTKNFPVSSESHPLPASEQSTFTRFTIPVTNSWHVFSSSEGEPPRSSLSTESSRPCRTTSRGMALKAKNLMKSSTGGERVGVLVLVEAERRRGLMRDLGRRDARLTVAEVEEEVVGLILLRS